MEIALRIGDRTSETYGALLQGRAAMLHGHVEDGLTLLHLSIEASDATGLPFVIVTSRGVTYGGYLQIGAPILPRALDLMAETPQLMKVPTGKTNGA
jgi:hypothetical protein